MRVSNLAAKVKVALGQLVGTPGVLEAVDGGEIADMVTQHMCGDWGVVDEEDKAQNDKALEYGNRVLSAYVSSKGVKVWVITEADRSYTTVMLPDEY